MSELPDSLFDNIKDDNETESKELPDSIFDNVGKVNANQNDEKQNQYDGGNNIIEDTLKNGVLKNHPDLAKKIGYIANAITGGGASIAANPDAAEATTAFAAGIPKGAGKLGLGVAQIGDRWINKLLPSNFQLAAPDPFDYSKGNTPIDTALGGLEKRNPNASKLGQIYGETFAPGTGLSKALSIPIEGATAAASRLLPNSPRLASLLGTTAGGATSAGLQSALLNSDNPSEGFSQGAKYGALLSAPFGAVNAALVKGSASPENAAEAISAAQRTGTNLSAAELSNRPNLSKQVKNTLQLVPTSGIDRMYEEAGHNINQKLGSALEEMRGDTDLKDIPSNLQNAARKANNEVQQAKRNIYNGLDERAENIGVSVVPKNYKSELEDVLSENSKNLFNAPEISLNSSAIRSFKAFKTALGGEFKNPEDVTNYLNAITEENFENPKEAREYLNDVYDANLKNNKDLMKYANQLKPKSFKGASLIAGALNDKAFKASEAGDAFLAQKYRDIRKALIKDMEDSAKNAGDDTLFSKWQQAQKFYKEHVAPFDDPAIKKYLKQGADPDTIVQAFVKTGQYARPTLLKKLLDKLPEGKKRQVAYYFLTKDMPQQNGRVMANANGLGGWENLDDSMKDLLVSPKHKQVLNDISLLRKRIPDVYFNPQTGQRVGYSNLAKSLGMMALAGLSGNHWAMGGAAGSLAGAPIATAILRNPSVINSLAFGTKIPNSVLAPTVAAGSSYLSGG